MAQPNALPRPIRRLNAARLVGVAVLGVLGMIVANAPLGHFGAASEITTIGAIYAGSILGLAVVLGLGALLGLRWSGWGIPLLLTLNIGAFLPALMWDLPVAGGVIMWNLLLLANHFFVGADVRALRVRRVQESKLSRAEWTWMDRFGDAGRHLLTVSLLANLAVIGFELADSWFADLMCLVLGLGVTALTAPFAIAVARAHPRYLIGFVFLLPLLPWAVPTLTSVLIVLTLHQLVMFTLLLARGPLFGDLVQSFLHRPALLILSTFGGMAGLGALVLSFPAAARDRPLSFIDALFTATSASCITGLSVIDITKELTDFGHVVLLVLIQFGGLGIMVLSTFATILLGGRLALRSEQALEEMLDLNSPRAAYELARFIVLCTFALEALGAGILALRFSQLGMAPGEALWRGVFHAVSAFCHAGFSLWPDSLIGFRHDPVVLGVHMVLILIGGLGFSVLGALWLRARSRSRRFSLQTRVVLWMTLLLTVVGTLLYALLEWNATLAKLPPGEKWLNATFQAVTLRSGGFASVDLAPVGQATIAVMIIWMFIGAAPGGTGGGIKVTTLAVMLAAIPALIRSQPRATLMRRAIPNDIVYRAATIVTVAALITGTALIVVLATHDLEFEYVLFEVVSAAATVGLSLGITPELNAIGKWVMITLMFIGRVGPTSLALALGSQPPSHVSFPEGRLMVG